MDLKKIISDIVAKIKGDENIMAKFQADPIKTVEGLIGVDLPDDQVKQVVDGVTSKLSGGILGGIGDKLGGIGDAIGGIFNKKD